MPEDQKKSANAGGARGKAAAALVKRLIEDAELEARERRTAAACLFLFMLLSAAGFAILPQPGCAGPAVAVLGAMMLSSLLYRTPFGAARAAAAFFAGFYSYRLYNASLEPAAAANLSYWILGALMTVRMKSKITVLALLASEAVFMYMAYLIINKGA